VIGTLRRLATGAAVLAVHVAAFTTAGCAPATPKVAPAYDEYRAVLLGFVDAHGLVDYASLKEQRGDLDDFVIYLERLDRKTYESWNEKEKIAFWINAYNGLTLRAIVDHYPIETDTPNTSYPLNSIRQIPGVWNHMGVTVMGQPMTLEYIEYKILRRDFHEPRIHMALVCAAISCPRLRNEPYLGATLDAQLDEQARTFLSDPNKFFVDRARNTVLASEIFRWYSDDFLPGGAAGAKGGDVARKSLAAFVSPYVSDEDRTFLAGSTYRVEYVSYDWTLNEQNH
jgi:Protein of unknown function, DUF547